METPAVGEIQWIVGRLSQQSRGRLMKQIRKDMKEMITVQDGRRVLKADVCFDKVRRLPVVKDYYRRGGRRWIDGEAPLILQGLRGMLEEGVAFEDGEHLGLELSESQEAFLWFGIYWFKWVELVVRCLGQDLMKMVRSGEFD